MIPLIYILFKMGKYKFLEDVKFGGEKVKNIVFEEEFISLPSVVIENVQVSGFYTWHYSRYKFGSRQYSAASKRANSTTSRESAMKEIH